MEERPPGRPPGYHHSEETRRKIKETLAGRTKSEEHKQKIRKSLQGRPHEENRRENISYGMIDIESRCVARFVELKANYPDQAEFFEENETALLIALRDVKSDKEIDDIKRYIETEDIDRYAGTLSYQSATTSFHAQEDAVIKLIDTAAYLRKFH
jgi:hypothetical protein